jgi:hypothetical protein
MFSSPYFVALSEPLIWQAPRAPLIHLQGAVHYPTPHPTMHSAPLVNLPLRTTARAPSSSPPDARSAEHQQPATNLITILGLQEASIVHRSYLIRGLPWQMSSIVGLCCAPSPPRLLAGTRLKSRPTGPLVAPTRPLSKSSAPPLRPLVQTSANSP